MNTTPNIKVTVEDVSGTTVYIVPSITVHKNNSTYFDHDYNGVRKKLITHKPTEDKTYTSCELNYNFEKSAKGYNCILKPPQ